MRPLVLFASAIVLLVTLGCEPSDGVTSPTTSTGSATVTGTIINTIGGSSLRSTGATVLAPGVMTAATVDASQSFTLTGVTPGSNVVLQFSGTGLDTQVPIGPVGTSELVVVSLVRSSDTLQVDHTGRRSADGKQIQGVIDSIGTTSFIVIGQTILTDTSTQFVRSSGVTASFADLSVGNKVTVSGTPQFGASLLAQTVRLEGVDIPQHLQGPISNLSGTAQDFQFTVESRIVHGDATTSFAPGTSFASLTVGTLVDVTGFLTSNFVQATRIQLQ